jgi:hypothetical protein
MCLPGLFSAPKAPPPPPAPKIELPEAPPAPAAADVKSQSSPAAAAPAGEEMSAALRRRMRRSLTIASSIGTPGLGV